MRRHARRGYGPKGFPCAQTRLPRTGCGSFDRRSGPPLGWHLQLLLDCRDLVELAARLRQLPVQNVVDHMGHMPTSAGIEHPGFQILLQLVREGRCWVKLSGAYRISAGPYPYHDVVPFARALIEADASRMVWGSDWPHPSVSGAIPKDAELLDLLAVWAPDAEMWRSILTVNPARLCQFDLRNGLWPTKGRPT